MLISGSVPTLPVCQAEEDSILENFSGNSDKLGCAIARTGQNPLSLAIGKHAGNTDLVDTGNSNRFNQDYSECDF